ncbi:MAG: protein-disulfide reductase DsbD domain-containing protein [Ferruginibacter sp.]
MKKIAVLFILLGLFTIGAYAQIEDPVQWTWTAVKTGNKTYDLHVKATINTGWHLYAQDAGAVPDPTSFSFLPNPLLILDGKVNESGALQKVYDPYVKATLNYYSNRVDFIQKVKLKSAINTSAKGSVTYVVCNNGGRCLLPKEVPFSIKIDGK